MPSIENGMRTRIAEFLPCALGSAIKSYRNFCDDMVVEGDPKEPKKFKEHHDACKIALAHIELLLKLAKIADLPDSDFENEDQQRLLQGLIEQGKAELDG